MNTDLSDLKQDLSDLMQNYIKLQSQVSIARQVNNKLKDCIILWNVSAGLIPSALDENA